MESNFIWVGHCTEGNSDKIYAVGIFPATSDYGREACEVKVWYGRRGSNYRTERKSLHPSPAGAFTSLREIVRKREQHGYHQVTGESGPWSNYETRSSTAMNDAEGILGEVGLLKQSSRWINTGQADRPSAKDIYGKYPVTINQDGSKHIFTVDLGEPEGWWYPYENKGLIKYPVTMEEGGDFDHYSVIWWATRIVIDTSRTTAGKPNIIVPSQSFKEMASRDQAGRIGLLQRGILEVGSTFNEFTASKGLWIERKELYLGQFTPPYCFPRSEVELGKCVSIGSELSFLDELSLFRALRGRTKRLLDLG